MSRVAGRRARIWSRLGFGDTMPRWPEGTEYGTGTAVVVPFNWGMRLRLLLSGKMRVCIAVQTTAPADIIGDEVTWSVLPPGWRYPEG